MSLLILMGKTCSGKDTIANQLVNKYGYKRLITYTTRPMRNGEKQDITYHFISEDDFKGKIDNDFFLEYREYDTKQGTWYYGSAKEDYLNDDKTVLILTPEGVHSLKSKGINPIIIYVYTTEGTIKARLVKRGDNKEEAERRILADREDFYNIESLASEMVFNDNFKIVDEVVKEIDKIVEKITMQGGA